MNKQLRTLPYNLLSWEEFEALCFDYLCEKYGEEHCSNYGERGQKQHGFDFYVRNPGVDKYRLFQCKKVESFTGGDLNQAIKLWEKGDWHERTEAFVIFSSNALGNTSFADEFESQKSRIIKTGITLEKIGSPELDNFFRDKPVLVERSFGEHWPFEFCTFFSLKRYRDGHIPAFDFKKKIYPPVNFYIKRRLTIPPAIDKFEDYTFHNTTDLYSYIEGCFAEFRPCKILLKAEAAFGKSKEMENIAYQYSTNDQGIYPVLIWLKNFKGDLESYVTTFYKNWRDLPPDRLLLLFDGLDEVPADVYNSFIVDFNNFLQANGDIHIIASIRKNFYTDKIGKGIDPANKLTELTLNDLDDTDIKSYTLERLPDRQLRKSFERFIQRPWLKDIIQNPFYLSGLTELFIAGAQDLPKNKADLIRDIIINKTSNDRDKFGKELPISRLMVMASTMAMFLTLTGRNSIELAELKRFPPVDIEDLRRCSLFRVNESGKETTIQFDHNNFQEYLAAEKLSGLEWGKLAPIIFYLDGGMVLKPKMMNTVNYLFTLMPIASERFVTLLEKIKEANVSVLLQFEKEKIAVRTRTLIFKNIILKGKSDRIYYLSADYRLEELCDFVNYSEEAFTFLLDELEAGPESNHRICLLDIIHFYRQTLISERSRTRLISLVNGLILTPGLEYEVYDRLIDILTQYRFF